MVLPASTVKESPVTYRDSSEARKSTALLMSSGLTNLTGRAFQKIGPKRGVTLDQAVEAG